MSADKVNKVTRDCKLRLFEPSNSIKILYNKIWANRPANNSKSDEESTAKLFKNFSLPVSKFSELLLKLNF